MCYYFPVSQLQPFSLLSISQLDLRAIDIFLSATRVVIVVKNTLFALR